MITNYPKYVFNLQPCKRIPRNGVTVAKSDSFYDDKSANVQKWNGEIFLS